MKLNDQARFARELKGDFSEFDRYMVEQRIKMYLVVGGIVLVLLLTWRMP